MSSDLADTWNIDIAQELENYLEELSTLQISLDGGKSSCNFAEAALLIQGSTSLYAKKVNSLYQLVYAALSAVTNKKYEQAVNHHCILYVIHSIIKKKYKHITHIQK